MPSKKKYNVRFPAGRIKKIMQTDEEVGKVAQAVPVIISRTLELFVHSLLTKTMQITSAKNAKTLSPSHMKQCILSESRFDFLKDLVKGLPDIAGIDEDAPTPPLTPAPMIVNNSPSIAGTAPTLHSDGCLSKDTVNLSRKLYQTYAHSRDDEKVVAPSNGIDNGNKGFAEAMTNTAMPIEKTKFSLVAQEQPHVPNFQISIPQSFQLSQPNFYTEVNPITTNSNGLNITNQPTSNLNNTAIVDEDYDT